MKCSETLEYPMPLKKEEKEKTPDVKTNTFFVTPRISEIELCIIK